MTDLRAEYVERVERVVRALPREDRITVIGTVACAEAREMLDEARITLDNADEHRVEVLRHYDEAAKYIRHGRLCLFAAGFLLLVASVLALLGGVV